MLPKPLGITYERSTHYTFRNVVSDLFLAFLPFLAYILVFKHYIAIRLVLFGSEEVVPNVEVLPYLDKLIFQVLPHRVLGMYTHPLFDIVAATLYLVHFPLPVFFILYLLCNPRRRAHIYPFIWCAGWVNFLAVILQLNFPTGPPWFTDSAVLINGKLDSTANNEAGLQRVDELLGFPLFHNIYSASPLKFGAMPSLHVAWPCIILVCRPWFSDRIGILHCVLIFWASIYLSHHYAIDGLVGMLLTILVNISTVLIYCPFKPVSIFYRDREEY